METVKLDFNVLLDTSVPAVTTLNSIKELRAKADKALEAQRMAEYLVHPFYLRNDGKATRVGYPHAFIQTLTFHELKSLYVSVRAEDTAAC